MFLKISSLAIVALLFMLFSGVACSEEYSNLLLGGIMQEESPCVEPCPSSANSGYKDIEASLGAYYFPMYTIPGELDNVAEVQNAATGEATSQNGLTNAALHGTEDKPKNYDTIVAYSGGTATAITALANYDEYRVTCDTLVLVSPMSAGVSDEVFDKIRTTYEEDCGGEFCPKLVKNAGDIWEASRQTEANYQAQVRAILESDPPVVKNIIVITSPQDELMPYVSDIFQVRDFEKYTRETEGGRTVDINPAITITRQVVLLPELEDNGREAHRQLFSEYARTHLSNEDGGVIEFNPEGNPTIVDEEKEQNQPTIVDEEKDQNQLAALAAMGLGFPELSPDSGISWISDQDKEGIDKAHSSSYIDKAQDVWFIDALSHDFGNDLSIYQKPGAPYRFASGEINSYGYNWIYLPYGKTGIWFSQGYFDWVNGYLESIGSSGAGYGLLVSDDSEF